jgi:hypothetical protein
MAQAIVLSGVGDGMLQEQLEQTLRRLRPRAIGLVSAFVTVPGMSQLLRITKKLDRPTCRLVAGTDHAITHPHALQLALNDGWGVRIGRSAGNGGIFHPKLIVAGDRFGRGGRVDGTSYLYVGSSNLTAGGLEKNVECGLVAEGEGCVSSGSSAFASVWAGARAATQAELRNYAARFAECSRRRSPEELIAMGTGDAVRGGSRAPDLVRQKPPADPAIDASYAVAAWAGLQSFTGEFRFQVEFPRNAGEVVAGLVKRRGRQGDRVDVYCEDDGHTRQMQYRFYANNSMFRLNVPNDVPGVAWARQHHEGIAVVEKGPAGGARLRLRILRPGREADALTARSAALGTWGRTSTRAYGWF